MKNSMTKISVKTDLELKLYKILVNELEVSGLFMLENKLKCIDGKWANDKIERIIEQIMKEVE